MISVPASEKQKRLGSKEYRQQNKKYFGGPKFETLVSDVDNPLNNSSPPPNKKNSVIADSHRTYTCMYICIYVYAYIYIYIYIYIYTYIHIIATLSVGPRATWPKRCDPRKDFASNRRPSGRQAGLAGSEGLWAFIKGGCSRRGVQWMEVVSNNETAYTIMSTTTPCFHCTPLES